MQRGVDVDAAAARTKVFHRTVAAADVNLARLQLARNLVDEIWPSIGFQY